MANDHDEPRERCHCGAFLTQSWYLASDEPNDWQDSWDCRNPRHTKPTPPATESETNK